MADEELIYVARTGQYEAELVKLRQQHVELKRGISDAAGAAEKGNRAAAAAVSLLAKELFTTEQAIGRLKGEFKQFVQGTATLKEFWAEMDRVSQKRTSGANFLPIIPDAELAKLKQVEALRNAAPLPILNQQMNVGGSDAAATSLARQVVELERINQQLAQKEQHMARLRMAAAGGDEVAEQMLGRELAATTALTQAQGRLERQIRQTQQPVGALNRLQGQSHQVITQLSFAVDDALTVWGTSGFAGAARAAGNNLSYVTSIIHPLLAIVPALGTALAVMLIPKMTGASDSAKSAADETNKYADALKRLQEETEKLTLADEEANQRRNDRQFNEDLERANKEVLEKKTAAFKSKRTLDRVMAMENADRFTIDSAIEANAAAEEDVRVAEAKQKTLVEHKETRDAAAVKDRHKKRAEKAFARIDGPLKDLAQQGLAQGKKPEEIVAEIEKQAAAKLPPELREFAGVNAQKIVVAAEEQHQQKKLEEARKGPDTVKPLRQRKREVDAELQKIEAEKARAEDAAPNKKLTKEQQRAFEGRERPLQAAQKGLAADIALATNADENAAELKKQTKALEQIGDVIKAWAPQPQWAEPPAREPVR